MALDLLANYERYSNNSIFYRITGTCPLSFRIVDEDQSDVSSYTISLSVNKQSIQSFIQTGNFFYSSTFSTNTPKVCAINVSVSNNDGIVASFAMSAVFVPSFPSTNIVIYPKNYINEFNSVYRSLNNTNFENSPGVFFYGEGHTEKIMLSCTGSAFTSPNSGSWFVGNPINSSFVTSAMTGVSVNLSDKRYAEINISSSVGKPASYPVSLKINNNYIKPGGPVITYPDLSGGNKAFYPFFASSMDVNGIDLSLTTYPSIGLSTVNYKESFSLTKDSIDLSPGRYKGNIKVLEYPRNYGSSFISPFNSKQQNELAYINLPISKIPTPFKGYLYNPRPEGFISTISLSSQFNLIASSLDGEWEVETPVFDGFHGYQFNLSYDSEINDNFLPPFTASASEYTTVTFTASCIKQEQIIIKGGPTDWQPKVVPYIYKYNAKCGPLPNIRIYTPTFYYTRDQQVPISLVGLPAIPFVLNKVTLKSKYSPSLTLTPTKLSGTMSFSNAGPVDLIAESVVYDPAENINQTIVTTIKDFVNIVNRYDVVDENLFQTNLTPLTLTYNSQPRLSPNEWATADNVNSIINKMYTVIEDLDQYTKLYINKSKLYAWIGPVERISALARPGYTQIYLWSDLDKSSFDKSSITTCKTWRDLESDNFFEPFTWLFHTEIIPQKKIDPWAFQRHCLEWTWHARKKSQGVADVQWRWAKKNSIYEKLWTYESCPIDIDFLNCNLSNWNVTTSDPKQFPIPFSFTVGRCIMKGAIHHEKTGNLIYAHPQEFNLLKNQYFTENIARKSFADHLYPYQNIAGLCVSSEGRVITLDNILCRISVYDVTDSPQQFVLFAQWGTYGTASNPRGFNKPNDLHIDQNNSLWVTDTGNKRIKKLSLVGKHQYTLYNEVFETAAPLSVCVDSKLQVHCLTTEGVYVFSQKGELLFNYKLSSDIGSPNKINTSYNREAIYITHTTGVVKYFRTGQIAYHLMLNYICGDGTMLQGFNSVTQDVFRNCYVTVNDRILKISDLQKVEESKAPLPADLYWSANELLIHKEEYIQSWVYLKAFHRLWDNIELIRSSLAYEPTGCKSYTPPTYAKEDLVIGQNEIVTNAVINRLSEQLWTNLSSIVKYFDPDCEKTIQNR